MPRILLLLLALLAGGGTARAAVLLDVGGANQTLTVRAGTAVAVSFTLSADATNVAITAPILCIGCTGSIWFNQNSLGPSSPFTDTLASAAFSSATPTPYFSFASLSAGFYAFILAIDPTSTGSAIWTGAAPATVTESGATRGFDWNAAATGPFPPRSDFRVMFGEGLNYTVTGTLATASVPEPGSALLLLGALGGLGLTSRRARRMPRLASS